MKMFYRRMIEEDVKEISTIEKDLFGDPWSSESFIKEVRNQTFSFPFVLELGKMIIGYTVCWFYNKELHIGNLAVKREFQGQGYGRLLLQKILTTFSDYDRAYLEVRASNQKAIRLYLSQDFQLLYTRKAYYSNGEDALIMVKYSSVYI